MDPTFVPSTPNPQTVTLVASVIRSVLALLSGAGIVAGSATNIPDSTLTLYASIAVGLGTAAWSLWQKFRAAQMAHAGAVKSATANQMGLPVKAA
jgi:ABC-type nickel/cobalt efflux system permease component RcnA